MQAGHQITIHAATGTYFIETLAQNAALNYRIPIPMNIAAGGHCRMLIRQMRIVSSDQNDWEIWFWANKQFQLANPTNERFVGFWSFTVAGGDGKRIAAAGNYYYHIDGLGFAYADEDQEGYLNVSLVNRSAGAKTASSGGGIFDITFGVEETRGF